MCLLSSLLYNNGIYSLNYSLFPMYVIKKHKINYDDRHFLNYYPLMDAHSL